MGDNAERNLELIVMFSVFGLFFSLWLVGLFFWLIRHFSRAQKIESRLGLAENEDGEGRVLRLWHDGGESTTTVPRLSGKKGFIERLDQLLNDAGWDISGSVLLLMGFGFVIVLGSLLYVLTNSVLPALGTALAVFILVSAYLKRSVSRRTAVFESQFVDALDLAARSLRAGHPLVGAFQLISEEVTPPVSTVFQEICQRQSLGVNLQEALQTVAQRSNSADLKLFATAVVIQLRTGGNLAEMMDRLASVIRDRLRLNRRVRVLTAQTQFSKRVLLALPFLIFILLNLINPGYMQPLYTTYVGRLMLVAGGIGLLVGAWTMNRLAVLRY